VTEQNDVTKLYEEFEEAFVDVLTAKSEGVSFSRRMKLRLARSRLRAHKDFTQREYDAAVLRADARAWKILGSRGGQTRGRGGLGPVTSLLLKRASASRSSGEWSESDYDVLADGVVIGGIMRAAAAPRGRCRGPFTRPASSWRMPLSRPRASPRRNRERR